MFVLVQDLTIFASTSTHSSPCAGSASPTSYYTTCDEDELHRIIKTYMHFVIYAMVNAMLLMFFLRKVADGAAKDYERVAVLEDATYKAAYIAVEVAKVVVEAAKKTTDKLNNVDRCNLVTCVVEGTRQKISSPQQNLSLPPSLSLSLNKRWRITARSTLFSAVCAHYTGSVCAGFAFYYSLEIQTKHVRSFLTIFLFVLVGVVLKTIHRLLHWVSSIQNRLVSSV
ncbi:hypothetical protein VPH35_075120 [Triticum aestivum]